MYLVVPLLYCIVTMFPILPFYPVLIIFIHCYSLLSRYLQFRDSRGSHTAFYWHLLALKLGFVIMFEVRCVPNHPSTVYITEEASLFRFSQLSAEIRLSRVTN